MEIKTFNDWLTENNERDIKPFNWSLNTWYKPDEHSNKPTTSTKLTVDEVKELILKHKDVFEVITKIPQFKFKVLQYFTKFEDHMLHQNNVKLGVILVDSKTVYAKGSDKPIKDIVELKQDKVFVIKDSK